MKREIIALAQDLGGRLRKWRKFHKIRLIQLTEKIGTRASSLSEIENGKSLPSLETLARLHLKTNLNIMWLMFAKGTMIQKEGKKLKLIDLEMEQIHKSLDRIWLYASPEKKASVKGIITGADPLT